MQTDGLYPMLINRSSRLSSTFTIGLIPSICLPLCLSVYRQAPNQPPPAVAIATHPHGNSNDNESACPWCPVPNPPLLLGLGLRLGPPRGMNERREVISMIFSLTHVLIGHHGGRDLKDVALRIDKRRKTRYHIYTRSSNS
jgi:hypothetical protein